MAGTEQQAENQPNPAEGGGSGGSSSSDGNADSSAAIAQAEQRRRDTQSRLDKVLAENQELKAKIESAPQNAGLDADTVSRLVAEGIAKAEAARNAREAVAKQFPDVDLDKLGSYESPDALAEAAKAAHEAREAERARIREEEAARVRSEYEAKFGALPAPAPASGEQGGKASLTAAQVARMSEDELDAAGITDDDLARLSRGETL